MRPAELLDVERREAGREVGIDEARRGTTTGAKSRSKTSILPVWKFAA